MSTNPRVAIYSRFSTDRQNESSTAAQVHVCREYATRQGWPVIDAKVFIDEAVSGTIPILHRPDGSRLMAALGTFDVLLINDLSRLARSQDLAPLIKRLRHHSVHVIGVQDGFDSNHRSARMQAGLSGIMSEEYISMISDRVHARHAMLVASGRRAGGRVFGYRVCYECHPTEKDKKGRPAIVRSWIEQDPETAPVVLRAYQLYAEGLSPQQIAAQFNAEGIASPGSSWKRVTRRKGQWLSSALFSNPKRGLGILCNEMYRGRYIWNRTSRTKDPDTGQVKYVLKPKSEWKEFTDPAWRIVDDALWHRVQVRQAERSRGRGAAIAAGIEASKGKRRGGRDPRYVLGGILKCAACGANLQGDSRLDYICPSPATGGCTNDLRIRRDDVHDTIVGHLEQHPFNERAIASAKKDLEQALKDGEREEAESESTPSRDKALRKLDQQVKAVQGMDLPAAAIDAALAQLAIQREALTKGATAGAAQREQRTQRLLDRLPTLVEGYHKTIARGLKALSEPAAVAQAREALKTLIVGGEIELQPNGDHTAAVGELHLIDLGELALQLAGLKRKCAASHLKQAGKPSMHGKLVAGAGFRFQLPSSGFL